MVSGDAQRQRTRVGGAVTSSSSAGNLAAMATPPQMPSASPSPRMKMQPPINADTSRPSSASKQIRVEGAMPRAATPPAMQIRVEAAVPRAATPPAMQIRAEAAVPHAATPPAMQQAQASYSLPDLPAPRSWTPSKLAASSGGSGSTTRSMTPAEALEKEMQELFSRDSSTAASSLTHQRPRSTTADGMACYRNPFFDAVNTNAAGERIGMAARPASSGSSPLMAQHNNLMAPGHAANGRPASSGSSRPNREDFMGLARLKGKLVMHGNECETTAVEAFETPASPEGAAGTSDPVVIARRKDAPPVRPQPSSYSRSTAQWEQEAMALLSAGDRLAALQLPGPTSGVVKCYVKRISNLLGIGQHFELRLESTDECLAVARRRVKSATSSFVIGLSSSSICSGSSTPTSSPGQQESAGSGSLRRDDPEVIAKLKANMLGTEYLLRGRGGDGLTHSGFNSQLLAVNYKPTINHIQAAPRTMTAVLPVPESKVWDGTQPHAGQFDSLITCMDAARDRQLPLSYERDMVMLHTTKPHYDPVEQVHYLDFKGRVHEVSVKNFQLVHWDHNRNQLGTDLVLLFGKKEHSEYALDFCYPMNALQAFGLGLSSMDTKLCYAV